MSTEIYDSPDGAKRNLSIDITFGTVWFFNMEDDSVDSTVTVDLDELPAIRDAISEYLKVVG